LCGPDNWEEEWTGFRKSTPLRTVGTGVLGRSLCEVGLFAFRRACTNDSNASTNS
jgi:hypothetical protein